MKPKTRNILIGVAVAIIVIGAGTGISIYAANVSRTKRENEIEILLTIARNEGNLEEGEYQKYRRLIYLETYRLPSEYQTAFNKVKPYLVKLGEQLRAGYPVSAMQYLQQAKNAAATLSPSMQQAYSKVEALLAEAFKLGSTSTNTQQNLNSAKQKSLSWWQSLLYLHPIGGIYNHASGYTASKYNELKNQYDKWTINLLPENIEFNKKLLTQDLNILKLFSESYAALTSGNDYFEVQKTPKG